MPKTPITTGPYGRQFGMGEGDYRWPLKPSEYMQRQVRVTPLVSADPLRPTLDLLPPELLVFSSDFPHQEGRDNAVELCASQLEGISQDARERFFGGSMAALMDL